MEPNFHWQRPSEDIVFAPEDFDILDLTLSLIPELRICALAVKRARAAQVQYPIKSVETIIGLLDEGQQFFGAGHRIKAQHVPIFMPEEYFPIEHEADLISKVHLALMRCKEEFAMASRVHSAILAELAFLPGGQRFQEVKGGQG